MRGGVHVPCVFLVLLLSIGASCGVEFAKEVSMRDTRSGGNFCLKSRMGVEEKARWLPFSIGSSLVGEAGRLGGSRRGRHGGTGWYDLEVELQVFSVMHLRGGFKNIFGEQQVRRDHSIVSLSSGRGTLARTRCLELSMFSLQLSLPSPLTRYCLSPSRIVISPSR